MATKAARIVDLTDFELYPNGYYALGGSQSAIADAVNNAPLSESNRKAMRGLVATVPEPMLMGGFGLEVLSLLCGRQTHLNRRRWG